MDARIQIKQELDEEELIEEQEPEYATGEPASKMPRLTRQDFKPSLFPDPANLSLTVSPNLPSKLMVQIAPPLDRSLGTLAKRFLAFTHQFPGADYNINDINAALGGTQKRRLYDVINVMEGAGLMMKTSRSTFRWINSGGPPDKDEKEMKELIEKYKADIQSLTTEEESLDQLLLMIKANLKEFFSTEDNLRHSYVQVTEVSSVFSNMKHVAVPAKPGTVINIPKPQFDWRTKIPRFHVGFKSYCAPLTAVVFGCGAKEVHQYNSISPQIFSGEHGSQFDIFDNSDHNGNALSISPPSPPPMRYSKYMEWENPPLKSLYVNDDPISIRNWKQ